MAIINAYQLLYSRVEPIGFANIPHVNIKRSGYQVVFHSNAITSDVEMIEKRIQCFSPKDNNATRYQFFTTPSGKIVVSHSVRIEPDPEITDHNQRQGAFIAHCLVFEAHEFARLAQNNPFTIIDDASLADSKTDALFIDDPHDMRNVVANKQEIIQIKIHRRIQRNSNWENRRETINKLLNIGVTGLNEQTLAFIGNEEEIEDILHTLITLSNLSYRSNLSFDTNVDKCQPIQGAYFAAGASSRIPNSSFINIDLKNPQIADIKVNSPKDTGYNNWLKRSLENKTIEETMQLATAVQIVAMAFEEGTPTQTRPVVVAEAENEFFVANRTQVIQRFEKILKSKFSSSLTEQVIQDIQSNRSPLTISDLLNITGEGNLSEAQALSHAIYVAIIQNHYQKLKPDLKAIDNLAQDANHQPLQLIAVLNQTKPLKDRLMKIIKRPSQLDLRREELLNQFKAENLTALMSDLKSFQWAQPVDFLTLKNARPITEYVYYNLNNYKVTSIIDFLTLLSQMGEGRYLKNFIPFIDEMNQKQKVSLKKSLHKIDKVDKEFLDVLTKDISK